MASDGRRFCENCGAQVGEASNFCPSCGVAQRPDPEVTTGAQPTTLEAERIETPMMSVETKQTFIYGIGHSRGKLEIYPNRIEVHYGKKRQQVETL